MRSRHKIGYKWLRFCLSILVILLAQYLFGQANIKSYKVNDGKMYIAIGKDVEKKSLDSFITNERDKNIHKD